jgi:hypothetical protein
MNIFAALIGIVSDACGYIIGVNREKLELIGAIGMR